MASVKDDCSIGFIEAAEPYPRAIIGKPFHISYALVVKEVAAFHARGCMIALINVRQRPIGAKQRGESEIATESPTILADRTVPVD